MPESASTDSRQYPQVRGARFAEGGGRFTGMPRMTMRLRYLTLKVRALCWVFAAAARGATRLAGAAGVGSMCLLDVPIDMQAC